MKKALLALSLIITGSSKVIGAETSLRCQMSAELLAQEPLNPHDLSKILSFEAEAGLMIPEKRLLKFRTAYIQAVKKIVETADYNNEQHKNFIAGIFEYLSGMGPAIATEEFVGSMSVFISKLKVWENGDVAKILQVVETLGLFGRRATSSAEVVLKKVAELMEFDGRNSKVLTPFWWTLGRFAQVPENAVLGKFDRSRAFTSILDGFYFFKGRQSVLEGTSEVNVKEEIAVLGEFDPQLMRYLVNLDGELGPDLYEAAGRLSVTSPNTAPRLLEIGRNFVGLLRDEEKMDQFAYGLMKSSDYPSFEGKDYVELLRGHVMQRLHLVIRALSGVGVNPERRAEVEAFLFELVDNDLRDTVLRYHLLYCFEQIGGENVKEKVLGLNEYRYPRRELDWVRTSLRIGN